MTGDRPLAIDAVEVGRVVLEEEYGTLELPDGRAIVFMPRWYYGLALVGLFAVGFGIGYLVFAS